MRSLRTHLAALVLSATWMSSCAAKSHQVVVTPVEVWRGGCCAPSVRLQLALEAAFQNAPAFTPTATRQPQNLIVVIPRAVAVKTVGNRVRASYGVDFWAASDKYLGWSKGSCWEDDMGECASRVVRDAERAARRIR